MYKVLLTAYLTFSLLNGKGQQLVTKYPSWIIFYKKFLTKIDTPKLNKNDFQIRLWFNNQFNVINTACLISLSKIGDNWTATSYKFTTFYRKNDSCVVQKLNDVQINIDSLYNELVKNGVNNIYNFDIPDSINRVRLEEQVTLLHGPRFYTLQLISKSKNWFRTFADPQYFYSRYKINELEAPANIIKAILTSFQINPYSL